MNGNEPESKTLISVLNCDNAISSGNQIIQFVPQNVKTNSQMVQIITQPEELSCDSEDIKTEVQGPALQTISNNQMVKFLPEQEDLASEQQMIQIVTQQDDITEETAHQLLQVENGDENLQFVQIVGENGETQYIQLLPENQEQILQLVGLSGTVVTDQPQEFLDGHMLQSVESLEQVQLQQEHVDGAIQEQTEMISIVDLNVTSDVENGQNNDFKEMQAERNLSTDKITLDATEKKKELVQESQNVESTTILARNTVASGNEYTSSLEPSIISVMPPKCTVLTSNQSNLDSVSSSQITNDSVLASSSELDQNDASTIHVQIYNTSGEGCSADVNDSHAVKKTNKNVKKVPDLDSPIALTSETTVYVKGKKCVLRVDPSTNQLVAYPVKPEGINVGKRPKGRPRKHKINEQNPISLAVGDGNEVQDIEAEGKEDEDSSGELTTEKETHALEGLLGLSDLGPDGRRKSLRTRKKPKVLVEDYEVGAIDGVDEESTEPVNQDDPRDKSISIVLTNETMEPPQFTEELDPQTGVLIRKEVIIDRVVKKKGGKINPTQNRIQNYLANLGLPVKRGRGRPRTNPCTDKAKPIPAFIIPSANGQAVMMAPVQGATAATILGKKLPQLMPKPTSSVAEQTAVNGSTVSTANTLSTETLNTEITNSETVSSFNTTVSGAGNINVANSKTLTSSTIHIESKVTSAPITIKYVDKVTGNIRSQSLNEPSIQGKENDITAIELGKKRDESCVQVKRNTDGTLTVLYSNSNGELRTAIATPVTNTVSTGTAKPGNVISVPSTQQEQHSMKIIKLPPPVTTIEAEEPQPTLSSEEESYVLQTAQTEYSKTDEMEVDIEGEEDNDDTEEIDDSSLNNYQLQEESQDVVTDDTITSNDAETVTIQENRELTETIIEEKDQSEEVAVADEPLNVLSLPDDLSAVASQQGDVNTNDFVMLDGSDMTVANLSYSADGLIQGTNTLSDNLPTSLDPPKHGILRVDIITPEITQSGESGDNENSDNIKSEEKPVVPPAAIIQLPQQLVPLFMPAKEAPTKIGLRATEKQLDEFKCPKCGFQAYYERQFRDHIATHGEDEIQKCKCCQFVCFTNEELLTHFKENHPKCICPVCDHMAEHRYIIKRHMQRHNPDGSKCDICGKKYKDQYILKMHIKMVHMPAEVLFECEVCQKKFTRKAHLKRHMRIHDPEKPFKCPHCDYRQCCLNYNEERSCQSQGYGGCERSDITKHILIHEEPKYCCEVCGKSFRHIKNKELHLKRHRGQRDYKCGVCDFYGYTFTDIRKHIERKHADNRNILCRNCGTSFRNEASLKEHRKICSEMLLVEPGILVPNKFSTEDLGVTDLAEDVNGTKQNVMASKLLADGRTRIMVEQVSLPEGVTVSLPEQPIGSHVTMPGDMSESQIMDTSLNDIQTNVSDGGLIMVSQGGELIDTSNMEGRVIDIGGEYIETNGVYGEEVDDDGLGTHIDNGEDSMVISMQ